ncbi:hypothetical protein Rcae01_04495 [Novipirellula caenicola]|uniref:Uncharacterized protein n=1 Tax=Novipirellula caenicola TaxID=1536901 RepID=A0ABP9VV78_9BACT
MRQNLVIVCVLYSVSLAILLAFGSEHTVRSEDELESLIQSNQVNPGDTIVWATALNSSGTELVLGRYPTSLYGGVCLTFSERTELVFRLHSIRPYVGALAWPLANRFVFVC